MTRELAERRLVGGVMAPRWQSSAAGVLGLELGFSLGFYLRKNKIAPIQCPSRG